MRFYCDFHIHSRFSRATSRNLNLDSLADGAKLKGLNVLGTGDFTHPLWLKEMRGQLSSVEDHGFFTYKGMNFVLTAEISTIFETGGKTRKIHHVIHAPSFEIVDQINEIVGRYGNLMSDGRPILSIDAPTIVEEIMSVNKSVFIYPAHNWTPFFGCMGSKTGFDSIDDCYKDQAKNIHALETGLSSDSPMNWRLSRLDRYTPISNSDSHSATPWRLGREANVFELNQLDYWEICDAIKNKDKKKFLFTVQVDPSYGKYHYDGHSGCGVNLSPEQAKKFNDICPKCGKKLTIGVLHRVEELADRPEGFVPENAVPFKKLLPLYEIISFSVGSGQLYSKKLIEENYKLIGKFGNEFNVLLDVPEAELLKNTAEKIAKAVIAVRAGGVKYVAGYDGEYGYPIFDESRVPKSRFGSQKSISDFK
jgi:uncharacterized protein (TIGR00375 family)